MDEEETAPPPPPSPPREWASLPGDVLSVIGGLLSRPHHIACAASVCRSWTKAVPAGVHALELDVHPTASAWGAKVEQLAAAAPQLSALRAHVSASVPAAALLPRLAQLAARLRQQRGGVGIEHLDLELGDGFELAFDVGGGDGDGSGDGNGDDGDGDGEAAEAMAAAAAAAAAGSGDASGALFGGLRSLTVNGGTLAPAATARLLVLLAAASPDLEELRVLPAGPRSGLGDAEAPLLARLLPRLRVLEFRACRLTARGLVGLARLPALARLRVHGLDATMDAATAACFAANPALKELHLGGEFELPPAALEQLRAAAGGLSVKFRWCDRAAGLLRTARLHLAEHLVRLDLGVVRLPPGDPNAAFLEPLSALSALADLRMSVFSNHDEPRTLRLSDLAKLSALEVLHLTKQHAYFPERRRMCESSIAVPFDARSAAQLAAGCRRLHTLRLCLGRGDIAADSLGELRRFSRLRALALTAEPFEAGPMVPVPLDLRSLPRGLTSLELRGVDVTTPAEAMAAGIDRVVGRLERLRLDACRLRAPQLHALSHAMPLLCHLKLSHVCGLTDAAVAALSQLTGLVELSVAAPHNRAVTQGALAHLAALRDLRYLSWQSDDLNALGPALGCYAAFTALRHLALSCSPATLAHACAPAGGVDAALRSRLPYATLETQG